MGIKTDRQLKDLTTDQLRLLHEESAGGSYKKMGDKITLRNTNHHDETLSDYKKDQKINYSYYDPSEEVQKRLEESGSRANWGLVKEAMGLKDIGSEKDLEAMRRLVNQEYTARTVESQTEGLNERLSALEKGKGESKPKEAKPPEPVKHSPEIAAAIDRVKNYQNKWSDSSEQGGLDAAGDNNAQSGSSMYNTSAGTAEQQPVTDESQYKAESFLDKYKIDFTKS